MHDVSVPVEQCGSRAEPGLQKQRWLIWSLGKASAGMGLVFNLYLQYSPKFAFLTVQVVIESACVGYKAVFWVDNTFEQTQGAGLQRPTSTLNFPATDEFRIFNQ